tara:strand:+ start:9752 stop:10483 length:732 start_codon:yes stop_codon:yes gene_type:complete
MKNPNILVVIPARGGSVGVPRKNIKKLDGNPLISYVINAAKNTKYNLDIIVSTDDTEIAQIAKEFGADVPFLRPKELSCSNTTLVLVAKHALEYFKNQGVIYDAILSLQPTAPLISAQTIEKSIEKFLSFDFTSIITVSQMSKGHPYTAKRLLPDGGISSFVEVPSNAVTFPRQNREPAFYTNGSIYLRSSKLIESYKSGGWQLGEKPGYVIMNEYESVDIDSEFDFVYAETIIEFLKLKHSK